MNKSNDLLLENKWERVLAQPDEGEKIWAPSRSFARDVWYRFRCRPSALGGLVASALLLLFALAGPFLSPYSYSDQTLGYANLPPLLHVSRAPWGGYLYVTPSMKVIQVAEDGHLSGTLARDSEDEALRQILYRLDEHKHVILDYSHKPPIFIDGDGASLPAGLRVWNTSYLLGTDHLGRDILTRLMYGTRISLLVAFIAVAANMVIGILYGGVSGYIGGSADAFLMRIVDIISTIPLMLYVILIRVMLDSGIASIVIALSSVYWVTLARVVRGQVLSIKEQEFVLAARAIGSRPGFILFRHLIPNAMGPILVTVTMLIPSAIFIEAFMSFIGIGIPPPMASLGTMCNDAMEALRSNPYQLFLPAAVICVIMFAFSFIGDGLRDSLDPSLRR